jgi:hypothetical protein
LTGCNPARTHQFNSQPNSTGLEATHNYPSSPLAAVLVGAARLATVGSALSRKSTVGPSRYEALRSDATRWLRWPRDAPATRKQSGQGECGNPSPEKREGRKQGKTKGKFISSRIKCAALYGCIQVERKLSPDFGHCRSSPCWRKAELFGGLPWQAPMWTSSAPPALPDGGALIILLFHVKQEWPYGSSAGAAV